MPLHAVRMACSIHNHILNIYLNYRFAMIASVLVDSAVVALVN